MTWRGTTRAERSRFKPQMSKKEARRENVTRAQLHYLSTLFQWHGVGPHRLSLSRASRKLGGERNLKPIGKTWLCLERRVQRSVPGVGSLYQMQPQTIQHPRSRTVEGSKHSTCALQDKQMERYRAGYYPQWAAIHPASLAGKPHAHMEEVCLRPSREHRSLPPRSRSALPCWRGRTLL